MAQALDRHRSPADIDAPSPTGTDPGAGPSGPARPKRSAVWLGERTLPYLLVAPLVALLVVFVVYPFGQAIYRSFTEWNGANIDEFVGLANYRELFTNDPLLLARSPQRHPAYRDLRRPVGTGTGTTWTIHS